MDKIHDQDVFNLLNWRRAHHVGEWRRDKKGKWVHRKPGPNAKLISPFTVNDTIEQLKKLFTYLKNTGVKLSGGYIHLPEGRVRALDCRCGKFRISFRRRVDDVDRPATLVVKYDSEKGLSRIMDGRGVHAPVV
jgi:hypothetical protein